MTDPIQYQHPDVDEQRLLRRLRARRTLWIGLLIFVISALLTISPAVWGASALNKYVVAFAFFGDCWGLSCMMHGGWDWWRERAR